MSSEQYNGWHNRETWLVNVWFGDSWESRSDIESTEEYIDEEIDKLPLWVKDFVYTDSINWDELKESCFPEEDE